MYRTTSVLALGLFLGLVPAGLQAQTQTEEPAAQQETQQLDTQQQDVQQQDTQQQDTQQLESDQPGMAEQPATTDQRMAGQLMLQDDDSVLVDSLIGASVYSPDDETIGSINDVVIKLDGSIDGLVIGAGGWLGVGERDVLVPMSEFSLRTVDDEMRFVLDRSKEQLEAEPEFRSAAARDTAMPGEETGMVGEQDTTAEPETQQQLSEQDTTAEPGTQQQLTEQDTTAEPETQQQLTEQDTTAEPETQQQLSEQDTTAEPETQQQLSEQDTTAEPETQQQLAEPDTMAEPDTAAQPETRAEGRIVFQDEDSVLASTMIGADVHSEADESVGQISDIMVSLDGNVEGIIIGVGGFLGIGEKDVLVEMERLNIERTDDEEVRVTLMQSRQDLEAAPTFERQQGTTTEPEATTPEAQPEMETEEPATQQ